MRQMADTLTGFKLTGLNLLRMTSRFGPPYELADRSLVDMLS